MDYDLTPGRYQVRVRYRGPDDELRSNVHKFWPDREILKSWPHEARSNPVEFTILEKTPRTKTDDLNWGVAHKGLQAAIEYRVDGGVGGNPLQAPGVPVGTRIGVFIHVRNISKKAITFISPAARQGDSVLVTDDQERNVEVHDLYRTGGLIDVAWTLQPGEVTELHVRQPAINTINKMGRYTVRYTVRFNSRIQKNESGEVIFPRRGDYDSELQTGDTPLWLSDLTAKAGNEESTIAT